MSEITRGVIGMPFKLAMGSEMSRRQFHACAQEVFVEKERLEAQVTTLKADPNSWQSGYDEGRKMGTKTALSERDQLKAENERLELENEDTLKRFEDAVESFTKISAEVLELRQQLAIPSDVLADCEALRLENEALRKDAELANSGRAKLAGAMSRLRFKHNDWDLPDRLPDAELILCCCGHSYPPSSYDAGFMAASGGVCEKCDAMSKDSPHD